jgi:hypothetical protein
MRCEWWWGWVWFKGEVKQTGVRVRWEVQVGFCVHRRVWGNEFCCGESWSQSMCEAVTNCIVDANFADACAFEDMIAKYINNGATGTNWLVGGRV